MNRNEINRLDDYIFSIRRESISVEKIIRKINTYKNDGKLEEAKVLIKLLETCADKGYLSEVRWSYESIS